MRFKQLDNRTLGILWTLAHCFLIACISAFSKSLTKFYSTFQIIFLQNLISIILLALWLLFTKDIKVKTHNFFLHFLRALSNFVGLSLYYTSLKFIPLIEVRAITLSSPIVKSILAIIILKEAITFSQATGLLVGLLGALIIILRPAHYIINESIFLVIGAVLAWSFSSIFIKLIGKQDSTKSQLFFFLLLSTLLSSIIAFKFWTPIEPKHVLIFIICGVFYFVNAAFTLEAYKYANITLLMPFNFSTLIFTAILAFFFFGETPTLKTFIGATLIFIASLYVTLQKNKD
jgi:drug/metabolite transporter (DMT)-like permease